MRATRKNPVINRDVTPAHDERPDEHLGRHHPHQSDLDAYPQRVPQSSADVPARSRAQPHPPALPLPSTTSHPVARSPSVDLTAAGTDSSLLMPGDRRRYGLVVPVLSGTAATPPIT